ncbi:MAG: thioredoxin [Schlesneria sp.]|nr:thioredoxin [Schlesneria sp.]
MSQINSTLNFLGLAGVAVAVVVFATTPMPLPKDSSFAAQIETSDIVLVKFGADWCGPCRKLETELDHLAQDSPEVSVVKLDVGRDRELAAYYGVSAIPHLILFKHGKQVDQLKGYRTQQQLTSWIGATK